MAGLVPRTLTVGWMGIRRRVRVWGGEGGEAIKMGPGLQGSRSKMSGKCVWVWVWVGVSVGGCGSREDEAM
jgi:hypothetical protein